MSLFASVAALAACVLIVAPCAAQDESAPSTPPAAPAAPQSPEPFGRIARAEVALRCFPTEISPTYEERLGEGDVVRVAGAADNGFLPVRLPLGVRGYVHKDFSQVDDAGVLSSKVQRLAFRYRPQSGEAPVEFVSDDTRFLVVEEQADWWVVRYPDRTAWVPVDAVVTFAPDAPVDTLDAAWRDLESRQAQAVTAFAEARQAAVAAAAAERARSAELIAVRNEFVAVTGQPNQEQDFGELKARTVAVRDAAGEQDPSRQAADGLLEEINLQERLVAAALLLQEEPPMAEPIVPATAVRDPLREYTTGWLTGTGGMFGAPRGWELRKGGQVLFTVRCTSGRYDLAMFEGYEVALAGPADRPDPESLRVLDVARLRLLGKSLR